MASGLRGATDSGCRTRLVAAPNEALEAILNFCQGLPLRVEISDVLPLDAVAPTATLAGLLLSKGVLTICPQQVEYPGDILYLSATLALCHPDVRFKVSGPVRFQSDQTRIAHAMVTAAWCYAACVHLNLPVLTAFHDGGYQGQGAWLAQSYEGGQYFGLPFLQLFGMAQDSQAASVSGYAAFPNMLHWVRTEDELKAITFLPDDSSSPTQ